MDSKTKNIWLALFGIVILISLFHQFGKHGDSEQKATAPPATTAPHQETAERTTKSEPMGSSAGTEALPKPNAEMRALFAKQEQTGMERQGYSWKFMATGKNKETLEITDISLSSTFATQIADDNGGLGLVGLARQFGFKKIVLSNGFDYRQTISLVP